MSRGEILLRQLHAFWPYCDWRIYPSLNGYRVERHAPGHSAPALYWGDTAERAVDQAHLATLMDGFAFGDPPEAVAA